MKKYAIFLLMALTMVVSVRAVATNERAVVNAGNVSCGPRLQISITSPESRGNNQLSGRQTLTAQVDPKYDQLYMYFVLDGSPLGRAAYQEDGKYSFEWNTQTATNGRHQLVARASTSESLSRFCQSSPIKVVVDNQAESDEAAASSNNVEYTGLKAVIEPRRWASPTNVSRSFTVRTMASVKGGQPVDVSDKAVYQWTTSIGTITSSGHEAKLFSGPRSGQGRMKATVHFHGMTTETEAPVLVVEANEESARKYPESVAAASQLPLQAQQNTDGTDSDDQPGEGSDDNQTALQGDQQLKDCLVTGLGEDRYLSLVATRNRLNFKELREVSGCFDQTKNIVPSNLAVTDPTVLRDQVPAAAAAAKIEQIDNNFDIIEEDSATGLVLSGVAAPNQTVLIYIFSEPLVLVTTADENGRWQYELTDPLEPGEHEAFVAVEGEDGAVQRSESFLFNVAFAEGSGENPAGFSLTLDEQATQEQRYLLAVAGITFTGLAALAYAIYRFMLKGKKPAANQNAV